MDDVMRADLDAMYDDPDGWAEDAVYVTADGAQLPVRIMVDETTQMLDPSTNALVQVQAMRAHVPAHRLPGKPVSADRITMRNTTWLIEHSMFEAGEYELSLERA